MISDRDEDALSYMTSLQVPGGGFWGAIWGCVAPPEVTNLALQVEEFGQSRPGCRIRFFFSVNPYFQNDVVAKEFVRGPSGGFWGKGRGEPLLPTAQGRVWGL